MLSFLKLKNFKSFEDIEFDLRGSHGKPKKVAFIYGENGSGKSNLVFSLMFLVRTLDTLNREKIKEDRVAEILSLADERISEKTLHKFIKMSIPTLADLIEECKMIQSIEPMSITIGFSLNERPGTYSLTFDEHGVVSEELIYQISKRMGVMFSITKDKVFLSPTIFKEEGYNAELLENIKKYWGKHTFLSIISNELEIMNNSYIEDRIHENFFLVLKWIDRLSVWYNNDGGRITMTTPFGFLHNLESGIIESKNDLELHEFEKALNNFFTSLYSDIKSVYYRVTPHHDEYKYELYFKKKMNGKVINVPFYLESTGTKKLIQIFPLIFSAVYETTVLIDEVDSGIHDLLMLELVEFINESLEGQIIATTHNTLLLKNLPKENVYVINSDIEGHKKIVCINDFDFRTHKNHSLQSKYLSGDYGGVPFTGHLDLDEIVSDVAENLSLNKN